MASVNVHCSDCQSAQVYRHVRALKVVTGFAVVIATHYSRSIIPMRPVRPESKSMVFKGGGALDTARTPKIDISTVIRTLNTRTKVNNIIPGCS
ncbi:InsA N-terminal domain [Edwardsiella ictaluri]|nr:InsA N-terminal domain [Edwardsiella ictaluri]